MEVREGSPDGRSCVLGLCLLKMLVVNLSVRSCDLRTITIQSSSCCRTYICDHDVSAVSHLIKIVILNYFGCLRHGLIDEFVLHCWACAVMTSY